jgi:hypothetical protein
MTQNNRTKDKKQTTRSGRQQSNVSSASAGRNPEPEKNAAGLPPNENIRKQPDEVYGDTKIPKSHRKK